MSHLKTKESAVIAAYPKQNPKRKPAKTKLEYQLKIARLATQLEEAKHGFNVNDLNAPDGEGVLCEYYAYVYLDTRKPKGNYEYVTPAGKILKFPYPPFYVGQGKGNRSQVHLKAALRDESCVTKERSIKARTIRAIVSSGKFPEIRILSSLLIRSLAIALEIDLIAGIGRRKLGTGPLSNMTDGGEGVHGFILDEKTRSKMSRKQRARFDAETQEQKTLRVNKAKATKAQRPEVEKERVRKIKKFNQQENVRMYKSAITKQQWATPGFREQKIKKQKETWKAKPAKDKEQHAIRSGMASKRMWASMSDAEKTRRRDMHIANMRANAKPFVAYAPNGTKYFGTLLSEFCRDKSISHTTLKKLLDGKCVVSRTGWRASYIKE